MNTTTQHLADTASRAISRLVNLLIDFFVVDSSRALVVRVSTILAIGLVAHALFGFGGLEAYGLRLASISATLAFLVICCSWRSTLSPVPAEAAQDRARVALAIINSSAPAEEAGRMLAGPDHVTAASVLLAMAEAAGTLSTASQVPATAPKPTLVQAPPASAQPEDDPFGTDLDGGDQFTGSDHAI